MQQFMHAQNVDGLHAEKETEVSSVIGDDLYDIPLRLSKRAAARNRALRR